MSSTITEESELYLLQAAKGLKLPPETVLVAARSPNSPASFDYRIALTHYLRRKLKLSYAKIAYLLHDGGHTTPRARNQRACTHLCKCH
jgi:hypothetical protein